MDSSPQKFKSSQLPLVGLLTVQLLSGIMLMPLNNFFSIYLNEIMLYQIRQIAQVIAMGQIVGMVASIVGGSLSDRWGHRWVLTLGIGALSLSSLLYVVRTPWLILVLWGVGSAGLGFAALSGQGYLTLAARAGRLGLYSALYNWGYTVGGAIGAPLAAVILGEDNFYALGLMLLGFGLFAMFITYFLPRLQSSQHLTDKTTLSGGYGVLLRRRIFILGMLRFLPTCYYGVMTLLPLLIKQQGGSNASVAWYVAVSSIFASLTQLLAGRTADRWGVRVPTMTAFSVILIAITGTILTAQSVWGLYVFGVLGVGAAWALSTLLPGMVTMATEPEIHGRVFGSLHVLWTMAMALGTLLGGSLIDIDIRLPFMIVGILNIIALILTVPFFQRKALQSATVL